MPSLRRISMGTEICPCAVSFDVANAMLIYYHGNGTQVEQFVHCALKLSSQLPEPCSQTPYSQLKGPVVVGRNRVEIMSRLLRLVGGAVG